MSLIVKLIFFGLPFLLPATAAVKTQYFAHLSLNSTLQLIYGISSDPQNHLNILMAQQFLHFLEFHSLHQLQSFLII